MMMMHCAGKQACTIAEALRMRTWDVVSTGDWRRDTPWHRRPPKLWMTSRGQLKKCIPGAGQNSF